jgi:hypothetical protein
MTNDKLVKVGPSALAVPEYVTAGSDGTEGIQAGDLKIPRLALAQALSPELTESDPKYVDGLKVGDAFNSLTGEVYGKKPLDVVIVRIDKPRFVEFFPRESGGGVKDYNVAASDPRVQFTSNDKGERVKPLATKFIDMIALLGDGLEPIALSFKGSGLKAASKIETFLAMRIKDGKRIKSFASTFTLTPTLEKNQKGTYSVFTVKFKGNASNEAFVAGQGFYDSIKDQQLDVTDAQAGDADTKADDIPF